MWYGCVYIWVCSVWPGLRACVAGSLPLCGEGMNPCYSTALGNLVTTVATTRTLQTPAQVSSCAGSAGKILAPSSLTSLHDPH